MPTHAATAGCDTARRSAAPTAAARSGSFSSLSISARSHASKAARRSLSVGSTLASSALIAARKRRATAAPASQPISAPPSARTRAAMARRSWSSLAASTLRIWLMARSNTSWCRPPSIRARSARASTRAPPGPPASRGNSRPSRRRARPSSRLASTRGKVAASACAAGRAAAGSARKLRRMPARSSRPSTRRTSASVKTWLATKRPSPWPSRSFWFGMMAVCGMGRPSGRRNSAVTANQSARPPTTPALAAAWSRSVQ